MNSVKRSQSFLSAVAVGAIALVVVLSPAPQTAAAAVTETPCAFLPGGILASNNPTLMRATVTAISAAYAPTTVTGTMGIAAFGSCSFAPTKAAIMAPLTAWTTGAKCTFMTAMGGLCGVRGGDGLPVELLHFGIE